MLYPLSYGGSDADPRCGREGNPYGNAIGDHACSHGPSPPDAVHERGSHGLSPSFGLVGAANSPLLAFVVVVVVGGTVVVVVVAFDPFDPFDPFVGFVGFVGAVAAAGGLTEKFVPVSTVTSAPPSTMEGS